MADQFQIIPYKVRSAGTDVPPEEIQTAINSLAQQTTIALNSVASDPTGPAGGDLGGTYPNPTVVNLHVTGGTESGVTVTGNTINSSPIGQTTPAAGAFTTLTAATPVGVASGGTGQNALSAHNVLLGEGTGGVGFAAPSTAGKMLISQGAAVDPAFANNPAVIAGTVDNTPVGATTPSTGAFTTLTASSGLNSTAVGNTTPSTGAFTTLTASSGLNSTAVGNTTPSTGAFTTLAASSTVSGAGFTARFSSPGPIGNTAASTGAFTTITATSTITPSTTAGIVGTTLADNAQAGSVGEVISNSASGVAQTSATLTNVTSVSLTAGDWDVSCTWNCTAGTSITALNFGLTTTSAGQAPANQQVLLPGISSGTGIGMVGPTVRFNVSGSTTVFLTSAPTFTGSLTVGGQIVARRRR